MSENNAEIHEIPFVELSEDEMRTIAREYVEGHGTTEEADMRALIPHCVHVLTRTHPDPVMPDEESMNTISSLIRRATLAVELPAALTGPTRTLTDEEIRPWARYIRDEWGPGVGPKLVRSVLAEQYTEEIDATTVATVISYVDDARAQVQLPGDTCYYDAPYPGPEEPR